MMKKFICKSVLFCVLMALLLSGISGVILFAIPAQFSQTYQHALEEQYTSLQKLDSPKVVVMGDSSVPFSLNARQMEEILKMPVQTLGIHSGTGLAYILRLSESNVKKGDIMVVELQPLNDDSFSPSIVLTACENDFTMYRYFSAKDWQKVIAYYPSYLVKKLKYALNVRDSQIPGYSRKSFDSEGNYNFYRGACMLSNPLPRDERETFFRKNDYNNETISFLNSYNAYCRQKGANVLITFSPYLNESLASTPGEISSLQNYLSSKLQAPVITRITDRALPRKYMYNNITHCNTAGADKVTNDLAHEIQKYLAKQKDGNIPKSMAFAKQHTEKIIIITPEPNGHASGQHINHKNWHTRNRKILNSSVLQSNVSSKINKIRSI